ncbi:MAG: Rnf-Nqr domain containing protein [Anaerotruncus massiliensis (ex Togo et al. 2019)]
MKLEKLKRARRRGRWFDGIFGRNPVLCCGLALPFAVMVTTSLRSSVSISILLACSLIPTVLLASLVGRFLPRWFSPVVYTLRNGGGRRVRAAHPAHLPRGRRLAGHLCAHPLDQHHPADPLRPL